MVVDFPDLWNSYTKKYTYALMYFLRDSDIGEDWIGVRKG